MQIRHILLKITFKSSPLNQIKPNLAGMVPGSVPFKIMSDSHALHPRWPPLQKIEISSNGQNCFILSQNVYKHNDELFNIYSGFFMNFELLPILTDYAN